MTQAAALPTLSGMSTDLGPIPISTAQDAVNHIVEQSRRRTLAIRKSFVQLGTPGDAKPGPLARIVKNRDERALDLYLLMRLLAVKTPYDATQEAGGWARALNLRGPSALRTVSRIWTRLVKYKLVKRARAKNKASMTPLMEDGSGDPYTRITAKDRYLRVPVEYWTAEEGWYARLELPAKAMLLIALSLPPGFALTSKQIAMYYGISADTVEKGFRQLTRLGVIDYVDRYKKAPLSKKGFTIERHYTLQGVFRLDREDLEGRTAAEVTTA